ncbi:hypothetical protein C0993_000166 [Termitomyces sp. T159_Od127]|nr:hypothetical protein C0993_000166 [Termitomyces sp. T159_Od127]
MSSLATLQAGFTFPDHIDIADHYSSTKDPLDLLPHTRNNKYLLEYIKDLHVLRVQLDAVKSFEDSNVRKSRSLAVGRVEEVLQIVRDEVAKRVKRSRSKNKLFTQSRPGKSDHIQFLDVTAHLPNSLPVPPLPSREVCREIGGNARFVKAFKDMAHKTTTLQVDRLKAVARGSTTSRWDRELVDLSKRWNHQVDRALNDVQREHGHSRRNRLS